MRKEPLRIIERSGLPKNFQAIMDAATAPPAAAVFVVTAIRPIAFQSAAMVLPGLNPNQPNQRTKVPIVAAVMLCPGIGMTCPSLPYLPMRGPSIAAPTNAAQPPMEWTCVEQAKSNSPSFASQPPPQIQ